MSTDVDEITSFLTEWTRAELAADAAAVGERLTEDFVGIGPLGFVLPREAWVGRFAQGLRYDEFELTETQVHRYGDAAVVVGRQNQSGRMGDRPLPFPVVRAMLVLERMSGGWLLAGAQMSFVAGAPGAPSMPAQLSDTTVNELQDKVNAALLGSDWDTLNQLVAAEAVITGPRGYTIDRDEWVGVHRDSDYEQVRLDVAESDVRAYGGTGVRLDLVESACRYKGETIEGRFRVVQVWAVDAGRPRLVAVQYTSAAS